MNECGTVGDGGGVKQQREEPRGPFKGNPAVLPGERGTSMQNRRSTKDLFGVLNSHADKGNVRDAESVFYELVNSRSARSAVPFNILIKAYSRAGAPERGWALLNAMLYGYPEGYGVQPVEETFAAVVDGLAGAGLMPQAWEVMRVQQGCGFSIEGSFIKLLRKSAVTDVIPHLQYAISINQWLCMNTEIMVAAFNPCLTTSIKSGECDLNKVHKVIEFSNLHGVNMDAKSCMHVLMALKKLEHFQQGINFLNMFFVKYNGWPDQKLLASGTDLFVMQSPPDMKGADEFIERMRTDYQLKPNIVTLNNLIKGYGRLKPPQIKQAEAVFQSICENDKPTAYTFSNITNALCSAGLAERAEKVVRSMPEHGLEPQAIHFKILLKGYSRCRCRLRTGTCSCRICECSNPQRSLDLLKEMETRNLHCDMHAIVTMIDAFCSAARVEEALLIVEKVLNKPGNPEEWRPDTSVFNMILRGVSLKYFLSDIDLATASRNCCGGKNNSADAVDKSKSQMVFNEMHHVLSKMTSTGIPYNGITVNTVLGIFTAFEEWEQARAFFKHWDAVYKFPKNMLLGYNVLLKGLAEVRSESFECLKLKMDEVFDELVERSTCAKKTQKPRCARPDTYTLNAILKFFVAKGSPQLAEKEFERLVSDPFNIPPDKVTFSILLRGYSLATTDGLSPQAQRLLELGETKYGISVHTDGLHSK